MKTRSPFNSRAARVRGYYRRSLVVVIASAILLTFVFIVSAQKKRQSKQSQRPVAEKLNKKPAVRREQPRENESIEEDEEGRENWFWQQRMYPFTDLPENAREKAWASRPIDKGVHADVLTWQPVGPISIANAHVGTWGATSGRVSAIAVSPTNANLVLIGSPTGGIWRSTDGGATFAPVADDQTQISIGSIAFAPSNPAIVYAGAGDNNNYPYFGQGVLKSTDGGVTWTKISDTSLTGPGVIRQVAVDPADPTLVYAVQYNRKDTTTNGTFASGFWRSTNGGVTWTRTFAGLFRNMAIRPGTPQTLYLGVQRNDSNGGAAGVYRSTNGGTSWSIAYTSPFTTTGDVRVAVTAADSNKVFVYLGGNNGGPRQLEVEVSSDGGTSWTNRGVRTDIDPAQFAYNTFIAVSPADPNTIIIASRDLFRSTDGGLNFTNIVGNYAAPDFSTYTPGKATMHSDQQSFAFSPTDANTIFLGNDGGLFKTTNGGTTVTSQNATLSITQFVGYAIDPTSATRSYGGTQDNGSLRRQTGTSQWGEVDSGDGGNTVVDPLDSSIMYTTYIYGSVTRFTNFGGTFDKTVGQQDNSTFGEPKDNPRIGFYPPFVGNGVDSKLYFGTWKLFTSPDRGNTWTPTSADDLTTGDPDYLNAIGVSRSNTNVIYTGSNSGRANVSTNGGTSWTNITTGLPNRTITGITVSPTDPATAFLTVSGFGSGHVFKTTNTGGTWTDISNNLPNIPTNCLLVDPQAATTLYVGTDIGVFKSIDGGATWAAFNNGMPPVVVTKLVNSGNTIQAATYGRGAYQLNDVGAGGGGSTVTFSAANYPVTEGTASINFTINRSGDTSGTSTVNYATSNGTAKEGRDYVAALGSVTFAAGDTTPKTVPILIIDNAFVDGTRTVNLTLSGPSAGTAITPQSTATVTITDNDTVAGPNPLDNARSFVQLHYFDFLNRVPDQSGWDFWTTQMTNCSSPPPADLLVCRINVSRAFFLSIEFQQTGYLVERMYKVAYGDFTGNSTLGGAHTVKVPIVRFNELLTDTQRIGRGVVVGQTGWDTLLENNKNAYASEFVATARFIAAFPTTTTPTQFVTNMNTNAGNVLTTQQQTTLINMFGGAGDTSNTAVRGQVLRQIAENSTLNTNEFSRAFILMQYIGYLRRNPNDAPDSDYTGYDFWVSKLAQFGGDDIKAEMVKAFITSTEYRQRVGAP
jgi:hypothetical protein